MYDSDSSSRLGKEGRPEKAAQKDTALGRRRTCTVGFGNQPEIAHHARQQVAATGRASVPGDAGG